MTQPAALVTGASRGIGAAIALELAARGRFVVCAARSAASCGATVQRIRLAGGSAAAVALDVADEDSLDAGVEAARALAGRERPLLALVNNAGVAVSAPLLVGQSEGVADLWAHHMNVNFHGPRRLCAALVPDMLAARQGGIVNIASSAALRGYPYVAAYAASKHALLGYTRCAALELAGKGVFIHALCPHYVDSEMTAASIARVMAKTGRSAEDARTFFAAQNPSGHLVDPRQVAVCAADLLCGEVSESQVLELDGGPQPMRIR